MPLSGTAGGLARTAKDVRGDGSLQLWPVVRQVSRAGAWGFLSPWGPRGEGSSACVPCAWIAKHNLPPEAFL